MAVGVSAGELRELTDDEVDHQAARGQRKSCSTCASRWRPGSWPTTIGCAPFVRRSRASPVLRERELGLASGPAGEES